MIEEEIRKRVAAHYENEKRVLMLSELGAALRAASLWPVEGDERSLSAALEETSGIVVVRDPTQKAFIVVVPEGREALAHDAIHVRSMVQLLRRLPRSMLIAFCLDVDPEVPIHLRVQPPFRYAVGEPPGGEAGYLPIEPPFRVRGMFADDITALDKEDATRLASAIIGWCDEHRVDSAELAKHGRTPLVERAQRSSAEAAAQTTHSRSNALERLLAVQPPEVAARMILPLDIAVALTRLP